MKNTKTSVSFYAIQCLRDHFEELCTANLDGLMSRGKARKAFALACCDAHLLASQYHPELAFASPEALKNVKVDVASILKRHESYTQEAVLAKFRKAGFKTQGREIFYDNPEIGAEMHEPPPFKKPSKAEEIAGYVNFWFVGHVMKATDFRVFRDALGEFNRQKQFQAVEYTPRRIGISDLKGLSIRALIERDSQAGARYTEAQFAARLKEKGFVVKGDTIVGHKSVLPLRRPKHGHSL